MENNGTEILREIEQTLASLKQRLAEVEEQVEALRGSLSDAPVDFTELEIGVPEDLPAEAFAAEPAPAQPLAPAPFSAPDPVPAPIDIPEQVRKLPWYSARPGAPVKHIRSGISLLDRSLFIGTLFKEDFDKYDRTLSQLDACTSLDQAAAYVLEHFPEWNLESDIVYSFMMAVRKKLG